MGKRGRVEHRLGSEAAITWILLTPGQRGEGRAVTRRGRGWGQVTSPGMNRSKSQSIESHCATRAETTGSTPSAVLRSTCPGVL